MAFTVVADGLRIVAYAHSRVAPVAPLLLLLTRTI